MKRSALLLLCCLALACLPCAEALAEGGTDVKEDALLREYEIRAAAYPETPKDPDYLPDAANDPEEYEKAFEDWWDAWEARHGVEIPEREALNRYVRETTRALLKSESRENRLYSPLNLWFALEMLSEITGGDSRRQIQGLLGAPSDEALAAQAEALWTSQYWDDGRTACIPSASLWLNSDVDIADDALDKLGSRLRASVFRGEMTDPAFSEALRLWLNQRTRGLLSDVVSELRFETDAKMSVCATLYYRGRWADEFSPENTRTEPFHAPDEDVEADFMHDSAPGDVYCGAQFTAVARPMRDGGSAVFVLPKEGVGPDALLEDDQVFRFLSDYVSWEERDFGEVRLSVPKLDCLSTLALKDGLKTLGVVDVFDAGAADFTPALRSASPVFMHHMEQYLRLLMDEEGVEAASITVSDVVGVLMPPEKVIDFTLDRPFLFAIMGESNVPLFIGVVYRP